MDCRRLQNGSPNCTFTSRCSNFRRISCDRLRSQSNAAQAPASGHITVCSHKQPTPHSGILSDSACDNMCGPHRREERGWGGGPSTHTECGVVSSLFPHRSELLCASYVWHHVKLARLRGVGVVWVRVGVWRFVGAAGGCCEIRPVKLRHSFSALSDTQ